MTKLRPASIPKTTLRAASITLMLAVVLVSGVAATQSAQKQSYKETVLHSFTGSPDGASPWAGLIRDKGKENVLYSFRAYPDAAHPEAVLFRDAAGDLFGTRTYYGATYYGGYATCNKGENSGCGTVFKVTQSGKETPQYIFTGGTDGAYPYADLLMDAKGNFFV
jgi:hypothetical protein